MQMSTELLGVSSDELAAQIHGELERLCGVLGADRGYVLKASVPGRSAGQAFEEWWAPGVERRSTPLDQLPVDAQRFWTRALRAGDVVHAADIEDLAERAADAAAALRDEGVCSILFVPLLAAGEPVGFIGFEARTRPVAWSPLTIARMRTVGELLVGAVERCQADAERAAASAALATRNEELERSNRELQQFASVVSHDLHQPLVVVQGFLDGLAAIAAEHPGRAEEAEAYAAAARRATTRMRLLIDDVLALARVGAPMGTPETVPLGPIVEEVLADLDAQIEEARAEVVVGPLPEVEGSPTQLRQLFQNLVGNAVKYRHPDRRPHVRIEAAGDDGSPCTIAVADNGVGIPAERRDAVFEMFAREDRAAPGLGIGLAVCARVVANHGGRIWIEGNDEGGTTVCVSLACLS